MDAAIINAAVDEYDERTYPSAPIEPDSPCVCGHYFDEHANRAASRLGCCAIVEVHERTVYCTCIEFELDEELSNGDPYA
ncbi:hypothetical protein [Mycobacterium phage Weirdo19]|uniref:Ferredoxin n=1 Tax=Mycobacterium phage Weirdo19 TaxID=2601610 RepID=A0A6M2YTE7_9CAUD|nr:hypothetical protein KDJ11_gp71 [Mycobacterium phage Weirdo19]QEA10839.1 hypothetical protein [Mycobacterium phage Weirdo19]